MKNLAACLKFAAAALVVAALAGCFEAQRGYEIPRPPEGPGLYRPV